MDREYWIREAKEWASSIVFALILTLIIRTFVVQAFKIPSGSMIPTLMVGDKLFVNKYVYRFEPPKTGDIVVFKYPGDPYDPSETKADKKKDFIKRLVAAGGQTVEIRDGKIVVDDKVLEAPEPFTRFYYYNAGVYGSPHEKIRVPKDAYFVLGDNSASSRDSRFWGFVPKKKLIGKAVFRWWPPNRIGRIR